MKFLLSVINLALLIYLFSFAAYYWRKQHRMAALGAAIAGLAAFSLVIYVVFIGTQEL